MIQTVGDLLDALTSVATDAEQLAVIRLASPGGRRHQYIYVKEIYVDSDGDVSIQAEMAYSFT